MNGAPRIIPDDSPKSLQEGIPVEHGGLTNSSADSPARSVVAGNATESVKRLTVVSELSGGLSSAAPRKSPVTSPSDTADAVIPEEIRIPPPALQGAAPTVPGAFRGASSGDLSGGRRWAPSARAVSAKSSTVRAQEGA